MHSTGLRNAATYRGLFCAVTAGLWLAACSSVPVAVDGSGALFYPSPPAPPRVQFLTRLSSQADIGARNDAFRSLVFGEETTSDHVVTKPYGVDIWSGEVFVVDTRGGGYAKFDMGDGRTRVVRPSGPGLLQKPINISIDDDGTRFVTDTGRDQIVVFDASDRFLRALGRNDEFRPVDVAIADDRLYVTDILNHRIVVLDKVTGDVVDTFSSVGSDPGELFQPTNLTIGPDGLLYITDTGNFQVDVFTLEGQFVREIGQIGTVAGQFARPKGVAVDARGRLYVVDAAFENVQILDSDGTPLLFFGAPGNGPGGINLPTAITIDYDNVDYFSRYVAPGFDVEYLILVASQFGANKVSVFAFGSYRSPSASRSEAQNRDAHASDS